MAGVYTINKGINRPLEFRGLKAQYIGYLGAGLVGLLIVFAVLYLLGVPSFICLGSIGGLGLGLFMGVYRLSHRYGPNGLMKKAARKQVPKVIRCRSRKPFLHHFKP